MNKRERRQSELEKRRQQKKEQRIARTDSTETGRWNRLYGGLVAFRKKMAPAYNDAVSPVISGAIAYLRKPEIKILVVGGGTGVFSRDLLPAVKSSLARKGIQTKIKVFETDITAMVKHAPLESKRIQADFNRLPFPNGFFDLVVGQSMIHHDAVEKKIPEIARVMAQEGLFIHTQDDIPNPHKISDEWRDRTTMISRGEHRKHAAEVAKKAHNLIIERIINVSRQNNLSNAIMGVEGSAIVPADVKFGRFAGIDIDKANTIFYELGRINCATDSRLGPGQKRLYYKGIAAVVSKSRLTPFARHLEQWAE